MQSRSTRARYLLNGSEFRLEKVLRAHRFAKFVGIRIFGKDSQCHDGIGWCEVAQEIEEVFAHAE